MFINSSLRTLFILVVSFLPMLSRYEYNLFSNFLLASRIFSSLSENRKDPSQPTNPTATPIHPIGPDTNKLAIINPPLVRMVAQFHALLPSKMKGIFIDLSVKLVYENFSSKFISRHISRNSVSHSFANSLSNSDTLDSIWCLSRTAFHFVSAFELS